MTEKCLSGGPIFCCLESTGKSGDTLISDLHSASASPSPNYNDFYSLLHGLLFPNSSRT